jgi:hypothetical protein
MCRPTDEGKPRLVIIGVGPHRRTHTASVLEADSHRVLATFQVDTSLAGYRSLLKGTATFDSRRWAVENARADRARHRLPRGGDRQLNLVLHIAALTQVRMRASTGRANYDSKVAAGKTQRGDALFETTPRRPRVAHRDRRRTAIPTQLK